MIEPFVIGILVFLMLAQNVFWARVCLNLTNRIMSRSYAELKQAEQKPTPRPQEKVEEYNDPAAERQARELNSLLGMA